MSTRWFVSFQAVNPSKVSETWEIGIPDWMYRKFQRQGHEKAIARILLIREMIDDAAYVIHRGWSRPDKEDACCVYIGNPSRDYKSLSIETPSPHGMSFLVFVLKDGTIDEWTWRSTADLERDIKGEVLWPPNRKSDNF